MQIRVAMSASTAIVLLIATVAGGQSPDADLDAELQTLKPGITLTLIAEHPDVVTPTGLDVDTDGQVWVASSHTHFRPENYDGPEHDEILVFDSEGRRRVFYSQTDATMDLELNAAGDPKGWVYLAERDRILRIRDTDGDGTADVEEDVAVLETAEQYPHNGLSGMCWDHDGTLVFGLGENYWKDWTLTGTDGRAVRGQGEGGIFRVNADGSGLHRIARGFWNPFGVCVHTNGEIFVAENDPGARPPCRLLHVVEGGDYGYQRAYGRAPFHPFVAWNGELRGTLPMLHAIGEAPCGIVPFGDGLLVPSWADHRIDFFPLHAQGAGFKTERVELVTGSDFFRPTCIVQQDVHTYYLTDWVYGSYELHQRGRVWKLEIDTTNADWIPPSVSSPPTPETQLVRRLRDPASGTSLDDRLKAARHEDPYVAHAALLSLGDRALRLSAEDAASRPAADRASLALAMRLHDPAFHGIVGQDSESQTRLRHEWIERFLEDASSEVVFETLRWIADTNRVAFRPHVDRMLQRTDLNYRLFEACLATKNTLSGDARAGISDPAMLLARINDPDVPANQRAFALRLVPPEHKDLKTNRLQALVADPDAELAREAVRTLAARRDEASRSVLTQIAVSTKQPPQHRANAIAGLARSADVLADQLIILAVHFDGAVRNEALRALRFSQLNDQQLGAIRKLKGQTGEPELVESIEKPDVLKQSRPALTDIAAWRKLLDAVEQPADVEAGRRIFGHAKVGLCSKCHRHSGRGNVVGPDLSAVSTKGDPDRLLRAILQPSRDVDPQYYPWTIVLADGRTFTGIPLRKGGRSGREFYRDTEGNEQSFLKSDIELRKELKTSLMPEKLVDTMTIRELRDLLAFLDSAEHRPN